jgi:uncharacterized protein YhbP (UPF0306 family)
MPIEQSDTPVDSGLLNIVARRLLEAAPLCAIATTGANGQAHINTAYFAWTDDLEIVWLSDPEARHSRNLLANPSVAIAVYDSHQTWGDSDRGIQLFGTAGVVTQAAVRRVDAVYMRRFTGYVGGGPYRLYRCVPQQAKLFDERVFGSGTFVTARLSDGQLRWERTETYRAER